MLFDNQKRPMALVAQIIILRQINYFYVDTPQNLADYFFGIGLVFKDISKNCSATICGLLPRMYVKPNLHCCCLWFIT